MTRYNRRSLAALFVSMVACAADPTPIDETGDTTSDSTTDSTSNTSLTTTDSTSTAETSTGMTTVTTTTDPTETTSTADTTDSSITTETTETTEATETTETTDATESSESSASSSSGEVESSSSGAETDPTGMKVDCSAGDGPDFMVTNNGFADYTIDGQNDPGLTVVRGCEYTFTVNANGHPFLLKTMQGNGAGNALDAGDGVDNNGTQNGVITWTVQADAPDDLFYNCQFHAVMTGTITVID